MVRNIDCQNFEDVLNEIMDSRDDVASCPEMSQHASECESCSDIYWAYVGLDHRLMALRQVGQADQGVRASGLVKPVDQSVDSLRFGRFGALGFVASIAVAIAVLIGVSSLDLRQDSGFASASHSKPKISLDSGTQPVQLADAKESTTSDTSDRAALLTELSDQIVASPYYRYSAELPYVRPLRNSINVAIDLFQKSFSPGASNRDSEKEPGIGVMPRWRNRAV